MTGAGRGSIRAVGGMLVGLLVGGLGQGGRAASLARQLPGTPFALEVGRWQQLACPSVVAGGGGCGVRVASECTRCRRRCCCHPASSAVAVVGCTHPASHTYPTQVQAPLSLSSAVNVRRWVYSTIFFSAGWASSCLIVFASAGATSAFKQ